MRPVDYSANQFDPSTRSLRFNEHSVVPDRWCYGPAFSVTRVQSSAKLKHRITMTSAVSALLISVALDALAPESYQLWLENQLVPTGSVAAFRSNVLDFGAEPAWWTGAAFDFVHFHLPHEGLPEIAEDLGFDRVGSFRLAILESDLVLAQMASSIVPPLAGDSLPSPLALDQFRLILGAHVLQRYGDGRRVRSERRGELSGWQKRRATELLNANVAGTVRIAELARECGVSESHFARAFKTTFGVSPHQWLIRRRIECARDLLLKPDLSLAEIASKTGFCDQAAFTRAFEKTTGLTPGRWRREHSRR
jgi:AraC family transcriptional regulator